MALFVLSLILTGCGKPFRVSEQVQSVPGSPTGQATMNRLMVEAHAMTDEDELMQLFNANLILARLLVVRIELGNHGDEPINLRRLRFNLRDAQGRAFRFLKPRKAVQKLYGYYEISTYLIAARKEIEAEFDREALQTESELTQGEQRRGLVYFQFPQEVDNFNPVDNLTVRLERLRWSTSDQKIIVELQLNR
jgi:hypothetical protein